VSLVLKFIEQKNVGFIKFENSQTDPNRAIFNQDPQKIMAYTSTQMHKICQKHED
jgi:hypothetical protein